MSFRTTIIILAAVTGCVTGAYALDIKDITFDTPGAGKVVFSHKTHLKSNSQKSCKSCHTTGKPSNVHFTMADMERGKSCGKCHTGRTAFNISQCTQCHKVKEVTYQVKQTGPVLFSHTLHLKTMQCNACHPAIFAAGFNRQVTMAEMEKGKSCGACHNGQKASGIDKCDTCHPTKQIVFKVKETGPTVFSHKNHMAVYDCSACHPKLYAIGPNKHVSMSAMEKGRSCGACHNKKEAFALAKCQKCHPTKEIVFKVKETGPTVFSHNKHLEMYGCEACHTKLYSTGANKRVSMAAMEKGKSCGVCHNKKDAFAIAECQKCHPTKELVFKVPDAGNAKFSHTSHLGMYKCTDCHTAIFPVKTGNKTVSMAEMEKAKSCGACHDGKTAFSVKEHCESCHHGS
jgi:c(7)-type cytochrome triheme protein